MTLPERLLAIHASLTAGGVDHAFGGAIALAYWTLDPRGTSDLDINMFTPSERCETALEALPAGVAYDEADVETIARDGQVRLWWDETPIDLFFDYAPLHTDAARHRRLVPFAGQQIPVLGPVELATFKAIFDRTRDWADIEAMLAAETLDAEAVRGHLVQMVALDDGRLARLDAAIETADAGEA